MMHPATTLDFVSAEVGVGVVATEDLPAGTIVWVRDSLDRALSQFELDGLPSMQRRALRRHAWSEGGSWYLTWDHGRYTNHSCAPNCAGLDGEFDVAIADIAAGEQITDDYAWLGMRVTFDCRCRAPGCRGRVVEGQAPPQGSATEAAYRQALDLVGLVPQALAPMVADADGLGFELLRRRLGRD